MAERLSVVIIGAGFGGIGMAIRLKRAGVRDVVVLEKAASLGGTWRDNTYPGAACDVPSHLYSFSFERKTDWSRRFPPQDEILDYLRHCADKYDIAPRFGTEVTEAVYDDGHWRIRTADGDELTARALITACGQLNRPAFPDIPSDFTGTSFHSARWNHGYDVAGKRVAVIGTGASAIQFVPHLAARAAQVHLFQRTPSYVMAKPDRRYVKWEQKLYRRLPFLHTLNRAKIYAQYESRGLAFITYPRLMEMYRKIFQKQLAEQITDDGLRATLTPEYTMGCKRVLISNDFYPAVARPNVELVTEKISRISAAAVITADGVSRQVDAVVYGTGFQTTDFLAPMTIKGSGGRDLNQAWRDGAEAYLGIVVSGFPNLFMLYGPNTNLGHNSIIYMLESQFTYVLGCLRALTRVSSIDVRPDVQSAFNRDIQRQFTDTVWNSGCQSWYKTASGRITNNWPGYTFAYRKATRKPDPRDFTVAG